VGQSSWSICPVTETFDSFTDASDGENGADFSRVGGGIHTRFPVADALTVGNAIDASVAADAGLPDALPNLPPCRFARLPYWLSPACDGERRRTAVPRLASLSAAGAWQADGQGPGGPQ
jgi:hypothetical protein